MIRSHVLICGGTGCTSSGSMAVKERLEEELKAKGLHGEIKVVQTVTESHDLGTVYPKLTA